MEVTPNRMEEWVGILARVCWLGWKQKCQTKSGSKHWKTAEK